MDPSWMLDDWTACAVFGGAWETSAKATVPDLPASNRDLPNLNRRANLLCMSIAPSFEDPDHQMSGLHKGAMIFHTPRSTDVFCHIFSCRLHISMIVLKRSFCPAGRQGLLNLGCDGSPGYPKLSGIETWSGSLHQS